MAIKEKKLPVSKNNLMHMLAGAVIFIILSAPFFLIYYGYGASTPSGLGSFNISRLFQWSLNPAELQGAYPAAFITFTGEYGIWLLPFILLGVLFIILRRQSSDILIISWLVAVYLILHLDVFLGVDFGRIARMLMIEPPLFFALMGIGAYYAPGIFTFIPRIYLKYPRYVLSFLVLLIMFFTIGQNAYELLNSAYSGITRMTPAQYEAAEWMRQNLPEDVFVFTAGPLTYPKTRWILAVSQRHVLPFEGDLKKGVAKRFDLPTYLFIDYSDLVALNAMNEIQQLQQLEASLPQNVSTVYDQNNIKIYSLGVVKSS